MPDQGRTFFVSMQNLDPLDQAGGPDDQGQEGEVDLDGPLG